MCQVYRQLTLLLICCFLGVGAFSAHAEGIVQTKAPSACGDQAGAALTYSSDETDFDVNNYVFSWKKGGEEISTGVVADNLTEGTYTLSVTNNVTSTTTDYSYTIAAPIPLSVTASSTPIVDWRQTASSDKKGSITLQPKGGVDRLCVAEPTVIGSESQRLRVRVHAKRAALQQRRQHRNNHHKRNHYFFQKSPSLSFFSHSFTPFYGS